MSEFTQKASARPVALRKHPTQARSRKTFDSILTAATELLIEHGWDGFNTNLLAERAGCRVATLYRYFPDKLAVVSILADGVVSQWNTAFAEIAERLDDKGDLRAVWPEFTRRFLEILRTHPGALAVREAMYAVPELRAIDQEDNRRLAEHLAGILIGALPNLPPDQALSTARVLIESQVAVTDLALSGTDQAAVGLLRDLEAMHLAYLDRLYANYAKSFGGISDV